MTRTPSKYQQSFYDEVEHGKGHVVLEAVAGSGKTTTSQDSLGLLSPRAYAIYIAFNKIIVDEMAQRMTNLNIDATYQVTTINAFGHRALCKFFDKVDFRKGWKTHEMMKTLRIEHEDKFVIKDIKRLVGLCKGYLVRPGDANSVMTLMQHHGIALTNAEAQSFIMKATLMLLDKNLELGKEGVFDFDDQLYLPIMLNVPLPKRTHVFADEVQDFNPAQMEMTQRMLSASGRFFGMGDSHQAIYGFRGSTTDAMERIREKFGAKKMPLSICYRCPRSVVQLAQQLVPHIEPWDQAPEGRVETLETFKVQDFEASDMVICRLNAPLVRVAYKLLQRRIPFQLVGKEFGETLIRIINDIVQKNGNVTMSIDSFYYAVGDWCEAEIEKLVKAEQEQYIGTIEDQAGAMEALANVGDMRDTDELIKVVENLFASKHGLRLSSIHRAKGTQAPRVFILEPHLLPFPRAKLDWQIEQEKNLEYVAYTRAQEELLFLAADDLRY